MKLYFKKLIIENFLSFGHSELDLTQQGYITVSGKNNNTDDSAQSNGSGKSSIFDALMWCLTGETTRGNVKNVCNIFIDDGCYVKVTLDIDGKEYEILRSKDHSKYKTNLTIQINNEDKSGKGIRDTQKILEELLPDLTCQLLGSVVILGQGLPQRFTNNTPAGRKEILEKLSKSDFMIEDIKNRVTTFKSNLQAEIRNLEDTLLIIENNISQADNRLLKTNYNLSNLNEKYKSLNINALNDQLIELNEDFNKSNAKYNDIFDSLTYTQQLISDLKLEKVNKLNNIQNDLYKEKLEKLNNELVELNKTKASKSIELEKIKNIVDVCPTCGQKISGVVKPSTENLDNELAILDKQIYNLMHNLQDVTNKIEQDKVCCENEYSKKLEDLNFKKVEQDKEISKYKELIDQLKDKIITTNDELTKQKVLLSTFDQLKEQYEFDKKTDEDLIKELVEKRLYINKEYGHLNNKLSIINKIVTLINRDFRGYLLIDVISYINNKAKEYSNEIFNTTKIDVKLNGNNLDISYCGKSYESLSGGEKQKIDMIIQFSLRDMLCKYLDFSSNILVIDECFDNLDQNGCQQIINLITNKLTTVESIYIITHHTDISIPYDKEIFVIKDKGGISKII